MPHKAPVVPQPPHLATRKEKEGVNLATQLLCDAKSLRVESGRMPEWQLTLFFAWGQMLYYVTMT